MGRRSDERREAARVTAEEREASRARGIARSALEIIEASPDELLSQAATIIVRGREEPFYTGQSAHFQEATALATIAIAKQLGGIPLEALVAESIQTAPSSVAEPPTGA